MADFRLRVTFNKAGRLGMLSHLELARALERAVRRADLPYAVTQGFSPHMKIAFGAALPVGVESTCEIFDVSLTEYVPADEALARLQQASALDLMPHAARYLQQGEAAASVAFPISRYEARLTVPASSLRVPDQIVVVRKKKEKVLHPAEFIRSMRFGAVDGRDGENVLTFELEAKNTGSLRPDVLLDAMTKESGVDGARVLSVVRVDQRALEQE
ncbi:TIGR03936 family radical SAM-associated protein [uncultured Slackia sp.]|uniref:TIGR03936 family radical SAM-associated protein n=1 Tax=uncultured Slackia sp. TaxID=665903 RepID=UPI0025E76E76|nr:TIGR03936 family radical SAM-associated protein [uncultured Slackia sp.]